MDLPGRVTRGGVRVGTSESRGANETFVLDFVVDFNFHLSCILEFLQSAKLNHIQEIT